MSESPARYVVTYSADGLTVEDTAAPLASAGRIACRTFNPVYAEVACAVFNALDEHLKSQERKAVCYACGRSKRSRPALRLLRDAGG